MAVGTLVFGRGGLRERGLPGPAGRRPGPEDEQAPGQRAGAAWPLLDAHGADAVRWFFAAAGSPWATRKIGPAVLEEIVRKVLLTYWNTASFLVRYANAGAAPGAAWAPARLAPGRAAAGGPRRRWTGGCSASCTCWSATSTAALEAFDSAAAGRLIAAFIDDLSNWYVRRSRRRFWDGPGDAGRRGRVRDPVHRAGDADPADGADHAVHHRLPVGRAARRDARPDSVHLAAWPPPDPSLIDAGARRRRWRWSGGWSSWAGRPGPARCVPGPPAAGPRPGRRAPGSPPCPPSCGPRWPTSSTCTCWSRWTPSADDLVSYTVRPNFRALGRRFGTATPRCRGRDRGGRPGRAGPAPAASARGRRPCRWTAAPVSLAPDEVIVTQTPALGLGGGQRRGRDRGAGGRRSPRSCAGRATPGEVVRLVQDARKGDGLDVTRPDLAALVHRGPGPGLGADRARGADQRRGAGGGLRRGGGRRSGGRARRGPSIATPISA